MILRSPVSNLEECKNIIARINFNYICTKKGLFIALKHSKSVMESRK